MDDSHNWLEDLVLHQTGSGQANDSQTSIVVDPHPDNRNEGWVAFIEYVAIGFGGTLAVVLALIVISCVTRLIFTTSSQREEWQPPVREISIEIPSVTSMQQHPAWFPMKDFNVILHPDDAPCLGVPAKK